MFRLGLTCVYLYLSILSVLESTNGASYDFNQVAGILDKLLLCLESKYPDLTSNATFGLAYGLGEYSIYRSPNSLTLLYEDLE